MTIEQGDGPRDVLMRPRPAAEALLAWLAEAVADPQLPPHHAPLVQRLNVAISQLAQKGYFDMRDLSQLLKDARDDIEGRADSGSA